MQLYPLEEAETRDVLELVEASEYFTPMILPVHSNDTIQIEGESMRKRKGIPE